MIGFSWFPDGGIFPQISSHSGGSLLPGVFTGHSAGGLEDFGTFFMYVRTVGGYPRIFVLVIF